MTSRYLIGENNYNHCEADRNPHFYLYGQLFRSRCCMSHHYHFSRNLVLGASRLYAQKSQNTQFTIENIHFYASKRSRFYKVFMIMLWSDLFYTRQAVKNFIANWDGSLKMATAVKIIDDLGPDQFITNRLKSSRVTVDTKVIVKSDVALSESASTDATSKVNKDKETDTSILQNECNNPLDKMPFLIALPFHIAEKTFDIATDAAAGSIKV